MSTENINWREMQTDQIDRLVDCLLECGAESKDQFWDRVINDLPSEMRNSLLRDKTLSLTMYLTNIVGHCHRFGAIEFLLNRIGRYEQSRVWRELAIVAFQVLTGKHESESREVVTALLEIKSPPDVSSRAYRRHLNADNYCYVPRSAYEIALRLFTLTSSSSGDQFIADFVAEGHQAVSQHQTHQHLLVQLEPTGSGFTLRVWQWNETEVLQAGVIDTPQPLTVIIRQLSESLSRFRSETSDFSVELIVPRKLFCLDFSEWRYSIGRSEEQVLRHHLLVLRDLARFKARQRAMNAEKRPLTRFQLLSQSARDEAQKAANISQINLADWKMKHAKLRDYQDTEPNTHLSNDNWLVCAVKVQPEDCSELLNRFLEPEVVAAAMAFVPSENDDERDSLSIALDAGLPAAIWFRRIPEEKPVDDSVIKRMLCDPVCAPNQPDSLIQPHKLRLHVWELQREAIRNADRDHPNYHLTLLFDDYDRVPPS